MTRTKPLIATAVTAAACLATPALASAANHERTLTIYATPHTVIAGSSVVIHGHLSGPHAANQEIALWHEVTSSNHYSIISKVKTNAQGQYAFTRAEGIVNSNRSWYVEGPGDSRSRTINEHVAAEVTMTPSAAASTTRQALTFTGQVTPDHSGGKVLLQEEKGDGNAWRTIAAGKVNSGSTYSIDYQWRLAGPEVVRVLFPGDKRNDPAASDPSTIVVNQTQQPDLTINSSAPIAASGSPTTISGTVYAKGTTTPAPSTAIALYSKPGKSGHYTVAQTGTTQADGTYAFTVTNTTNAVYEVRTTPTKHAQSSAPLFQAVSDTVTFGASATASTVGGSVTFSGTIAPDKSGSVAYLQILGRDGQWHPVEASTIATGSAFSFTVQFGNAGAKEYRVRIGRGPLNVGGICAPVTVTVGLPAVGALPTS